MNIEIYTPNGLVGTKESKSVVIMDFKSLSFGLLDNHVPVLSKVKSGYITFEEGGAYALLNSIIEFKNNKLTVITEYTAFGDDKEKALELLQNNLENRIKQNKERNKELALQELELRKQIKKSGAGKL